MVTGLATLKYMIIQTTDDKGINNFSIHLWFHLKTCAIIEETFLHGITNELVQRHVSNPNQGKGALPVYQPGGGKGQHLGCEGGYLSPLYPAYERVLGDQ